MHISRRTQAGGSLRAVCRNARPSANSRTLYPALSNTAVSVSRMSQSSSTTKMSLIIVQSILVAVPSFPRHLTFFTACRPRPRFDLTPAVRLSAAENQIDLMKSRPVMPRTGMTRCSKFNRRRAIPLRTNTSLSTAGTAVASAALHRTIPPGVAPGDLLVASIGIGKIFAGIAAILSEDGPI